MGYVSIDGLTNHPDLLIENSAQYTSKEKSVWTLNISKEVVFSDFIYNVRLPENSQINALSSTGSIRIGDQSGRIVVTGFGENKSLSIIIQYQVDKIENNEQGLELDLFSIVLIISIIVLIILFFIVFLFVNDKNNSLQSKNKSTSKSELRGLNNRQKEIINLLQKSKIALTQTDIQRELGIPKASVSRNIRRLELKGLIEKEQIGMSNLIRLKTQ